MRNLIWTGEGSPRVSAVPINSPGDQPLYGLGNKLMQPLYKRTEEDRANQCFLPLGNPYISDYCLASVRNTPQKPTANPAFVVFPTTSWQAQQCVKFAVKHNLCVMVAGTGHDFLGRHSCDEAIFIRTSLYK